MARSFGRYARETRRSTYRKGDKATDYAAPREWTTTGFTVVEMHRPDGWRFYGTFTDARRAFGLDRAAS